MKKIYNKLIRDNLIEKMENKGLKVEYHILEEDEYDKELDKKLKEEVNEYIEDYSIEEMADVMEVIYTIMEHRNIKMEDVEKARIEKRYKNGAFNKKIFLESADE